MRTVCARKEAEGRGLGEVANEKRNVNGGGGEGRKRRSGKRRK